MGKKKQELALTVASKEGLELFKAVGLQLGFDENKVNLIAEFMEVSELLAQRLEASSPSYLSLPPDLEMIERDAVFLRARPHGRLFYQDTQTELDEENNKIVRDPYLFELGEVLDLVDAQVRPVDRRQAVYTPLVWRVGFMVGFLSGLAVPQPQEAQKGLIILVSLVRPLLVAAPGSQDVPLLSSPEKK